MRLAHRGSHDRRAVSGIRTYDDIPTAREVFGEHRVSHHLGGTPCARNHDGISTLIAGERRALATMNAYPRKVPGKRVRHQDAALTSECISPEPGRIFGRTAGAGNRRIPDPYHQLAINGLRRRSKIINTTVLHPVEGGAADRGRVRSAWAAPSRSDVRTTSPSGLAVARPNLRDRDGHSGSGAAQNGEIAESKVSPRRLRDIEGGSSRAAPARLF